MMKRQEGYAGILFIAFFLVTLIVLFGLSGKDKGMDIFNSIHDIHKHRTLESRWKLFDYAVNSDSLLSFRDWQDRSSFVSSSRWTGIGYLPCPDFDGDGEEDAGCANPDYTGFERTNVSLSGEATSGVDGVGYLPLFVSDTGFHLSPRTEKRSLYLVDTRFTKQNECYTGGSYPLNPYMDVRTYVDVDNRTISANVFPSTNLSCTANGYAQPTDYDANGIGLSILNMEKAINEDWGKGAKENASIFLNGKTLSYQTLMSCDSGSCLDDSGLMNPYASPKSAFFDPAMLPHIKVNGKPFYVAVVISPGEDGRFQSTIEKGYYVKSGVRYEDDTVNVIPKGDDVIVPIHWLNWLKEIQDRICSDRPAYKDMLIDYIKKGASKSAHWALLRDEENVFSGYENIGGQNWLPILFPDAFNDDQLPDFSFCDVKINVLND